MANRIALASKCLRISFGFTATVVRKNSTTVTQHRPRGCEHGVRGDKCARVTSTVPSERWRCAQFTNNASSSQPFEQTPTDPIRSSECSVIYSPELIGPLLSREGGAFVMLEGRLETRLPGGH